MKPSLKYPLSIIWIIALISILPWLLSACEPGGGTPAALEISPTSENTATPTQTASPYPSDTPTPTLTDTPSQTPAPTDTPTITLTPSITPTPTITLTPTFDYPDVTVKETAHCRYGPGTAYLHAADLYEGDQGQLWNRNYSGTWVWVKFDKINYACWVAASLVDVVGDIFSVTTYFHPLPKSTLYGPVEAVEAERQGDSVVVSWDEIWMTEDDFRGYLIEAQVCQNGFFIDVAYHSDKSPITILDEDTCQQESNGKLYAVEKHGYTDPIAIPWP
jgi:hypothetical protein